jgi:RNA recognition motif-containing protein
MNYIIPKQTLFNVLTTFNSSELELNDKDQFEECIIDDTNSTINLTTIYETYKEWFRQSYPGQTIQNKQDVQNYFENIWGECERSKNVILIKNISPTINKDKLEEYFSRYGMLVRFILSPSNTIGIAEYVDKKHADNCMKKLAYFEIDTVPLYLEYAPEGLVRKNVKQNTSLETSNENANSSDKKDNIDLKKSQGKVLFITNFNFSTKESRLKKFFEEKGYKISNVKIVTHKKEDSDKTLSAGYGFVEFSTEEEAQKAIRNLQGVLLDAHSFFLNNNHVR